MLAVGWCCGRFRCWRPTFLRLEIGFWCKLDERSQFRITYFNGNMLQPILRGARAAIWEFLGILFFGWTDPGAGWPLTVSMSLKRG